MNIKLIREKPTLKSFINKLLKRKSGWIIIKRQIDIRHYDKHPEEY